MSDTMWNSFRAICNLCTQPDQMAQQDTGTLEPFAVIEIVSGAGAAL